RYRAVADGGRQGRAVRHRARPKPTVDARGGAVHPPQTRQEAEVVARRRTEHRTDLGRLQARRPHRGLGEIGHLDDPATRSGLLQTRRGRVGRRPDQHDVAHFSPVVEMPRMRYFWAKAKKHRIGSSESNDIAMSVATPSFEVESTSALSATGTV